MTSVDELLALARGMQRTPWVHQGRLPGVGLDCVGFVQAITRAAGALPPHIEIPADYGRNPLPGALEAYLRLFCAPVSRIEAGCLLLLRMPSAVRHVALCAGDTLIHCVQPHGVVEHGYRHPYPARTASAWRLPNIHYPEASA